ncbi:DNA methyltransferase [Citrobacter braakii]|uniref:DNA methyltransferase n=1 Tax=Citrobacter TaxID=544 RepID=UPI0023B26F03|nr:MULTISPECIES: DNA methyltransferase [Citrobacter]MDE9688929.1 site-specific DNA-methyltransferase [Citrobacter portucalensis]MDM3359608.1 site-specific DNA-methyltransferase [Citrobacter sp. Cb002]HAX9835786.1 site-specific DNA-methyltransferase [Escherichia coli]
MQQDSLFSSDNSQQMQAAGPVICLGKTFANDLARREYFLSLLAEKLKDPEFRKIEGFPIGSDEDILNLSDPPYYTVCPNPWIGDFVAEWEAQKPACDEEYHREPFAADVSEGKNDPIYSAHSYHTKVPHKAIMRYILHYTNPGDIVFDGFCGTGMTGVAAQMCGDKETVMSLGYQVNADGTILQEESDENGRVVWKAFSKLGARRAVLNDLSPAATFIAYNYNTPVELQSFEKEAKKILKEVEQECEWMYVTKHTDGRLGKINYTVWSDVFICQECMQEVVFWDAAVDNEAGKVNDNFLCPYCKTHLTKRSMERSWVTKYDHALKKSVKQAKQVPVLISYTIDSKRAEKTPDIDDIQLIDKIENMIPSHWYPSDRMMEGKETRRNEPIGVTHIHHFYTKRNLYSLAAIARHSTPLFNIAQMSMWWTNTKMYRYRWAGGFAGAGGGPLAGTLYIPSLFKDISILESMKDNFKKSVRKKKLLVKMQPQVISCGSSETLALPSNSLDYLFIDPPFGANLNYSELSFIWESWLKIKTNNISEAIENSSQNKGLVEYRHLMTLCFKEAHRILKPGRWMTVEFSNTKASVWNSIQTALTDAGFIIANVSALDKKQGSFKAVNTPTAVKQDLVISAYKPNGGFEDRFTGEATTKEGVWDFIRTHLKYLPVTKSQGSVLLSIPERDPRILFDQLVAYYVRKGYQLPIDSKEFQIGLTQRFSERDGMFFLHEQAAKYDKKKLISEELSQVSLFVKDEASAIDWLRQQLKYKPQTFSDINPQFMQQLGGWSKNETVLDLRELLSQNFLCFDGQDEVPDQIHSYLSSNWKELRNLPKNDQALVAKAKDRWYVPDPNKAGDLEKLREKSLLKEFEEYKAAKKKLKIFRIEAVRVGFKKLWEQQEFATLIAIADKLPNNVLEEDPVLLMYYDQAVTLSQVDTDDEW